MERYERRNGRYVLYLDGMQALQTEVVALLIDAQLGRLVTHGDPASVRKECDGLRALTQPGRWLLLEGKPSLRALNCALAGKLDLRDLHQAFSSGTAEALARELIARVSRMP